MTIMATGLVSLALAACAANSTPTTTTGNGGIAIQNPVAISVGTTAAPGLLIEQVRLAAEAGSQAAQARNAVQVLPMTGEMCAGK